MNKKTYNVNELLEMKKDLEEKINNKIKEVNQQSLMYEKQTIKDLENKDNNKTFEPRKKVSVQEYTQEVDTMLDQLSKIKTEIQKFNAENITNLLYKRERMRKLLVYLKRIYTDLPLNKNQGRKIMRKNKDGRALEVNDFTQEPMFEKEIIEKRMNETAAEERKLNTEIQKKNLNAKIEI